MAGCFYGYMDTCIRRSGLAMVVPARHSTDCCRHPLDLLGSFGWLGLAGKPLEPRRGGGAPSGAGRPVPMSRNCRMPQSAARNRATRAKMPGWPARRPLPAGGPGSVPWPPSGQIRSCLCHRAMRHKSGRCSGSRLQASAGPAWLLRVEFGSAAGRDRPETLVWDRRRQRACATVFQGTHRPYPCSWP
jgi:hypothetical protein